MFRQQKNQKVVHSPLGKSPAKVLQPSFIKSSPVKHSPVKHSPVKTTIVRSPAKMMASPFKQIAEANAVIEELKPRAPPAVRQQQLQKLRSTSTDSILPKSFCNSARLSPQKQQPPIPEKRHPAHQQDEVTKSQTKKS